MIVAPTQPMFELSSPPVPGSGSVAPEDLRGVGGRADLRTLTTAVLTEWMGFFAVASRQEESLSAQFSRHAERWRAETGFMSSVRDKVLHRSYQQIIGMGKKAVPLILRDLQKRPDHWFWALSAITGVDPVPPSDRGRIRRMTDSWLRWGRAQGFLDR